MITKQLKEIIPAALANTPQLLELISLINDKPKDKIHWEVLLLVLFKMDKDDIAIDVQTLWVHHNKRLIYGWLDLAELLTNNNQEEKAIKVLKEALEIKDSPLFWIKLTKITESSSSKEDVIETYEKAIKAHGNFRNLIINYANYLHTINSPQKALEILNKKEHSHRNLIKKTKYYLIKSKIYQDLGNYKESKKQIDKIIHRSPNSPEGWRRIAELEQHFSNPESHNISQKIERSIEFPPEYYQAGISTLNYFSTILKQKYPDTKVSVTIKQEGLKVSMIIETEDGKIEEIEKTLEDYGLVVKGEKEPSELLSNPIEVQALRTKLEIVKTELNLTRDLLYCERSQYENRIQSLDSEVKRLYSLVSKGLSHQSNLQKILEHSIKDTNSTTEASLNLLKIKLDNGIKETDKNEIIEALSDIKQNDPGFFERIHESIISGSISGASGSLLYKWIISFCSALPH